MKLIVGLGNPGIEYENTRHNIGFKAIDAFSHKLKVELKKKKYNGLIYHGDSFILAKPMTYMNNSGDFVQRIAKYFKIDLKDILIIYDDMDTEVGQIKFREAGSSGGQKGMADIIIKMGTDKIPRLKIGIGRPNNKGIEHVLGHFSPTQIQKLDEIKNDIIKRLEDFIN